MHLAASPGAEALHDQSLDFDHSLKRRLGSMPEATRKRPHEDHVINKKDSSEADVKHSSQLDFECKASEAPVNEPAQSRPIVFIEACAGCAILSSIAVKRGFHVLPFDCSRNRHRPFCALFEFDLSAPYALEILVKLCDDFHIAAVHIGLPCGTCSKARGIPLADGSQGPPPLRDFEFLHGFPNLRPHDETKVKAANKLYAAMNDFVQILHRRQIPWTIENPTNSWLWELPELCFAMAHGTMVDLHACAYGGERLKQTSFLCSHDIFLALSRFCQGDHEHKGLGFDAESQTFNTAKEAEYPRALCEAYMDILVRLTESRGLVLDTQADFSTFKPQHQKRGRKTPPTISEFLQARAVLLASIPSLDTKKCLTEDVRDIPVGSKLLRTEAKEGKILCVFGIFRSMHDFVQVAKSLKHPFDELMNLPDVLIKCLFDTLNLGMLEITKRRINTLKKWTCWAKELQEEEQNIQKSLHPKIAFLMRNKRLALLQKLANDIGWPDKDLHAELREGFKLTGYTPPTGVFKCQVKPAKFDKKKLMSDAKFLKPFILGKMSNLKGDMEDERQLYDITLKEATEKGWLEGPFKVSEMDSEYKDRWLPVRRFGIWQKGKLRPIDDMKENRLNDSFTCCDKIDLNAMDHILWSLCVCVRHCIHSGDMDFRMSDGSRLRGSVHESWQGVEPNSKMTSFDLASAYKQLPLHPDEYDCTIICLKNPDTQEIEWPAFFTLTEHLVSCGDWAWNCIWFGQTISVIFHVWHIRRRQPRLCIVRSPFLDFWDLALRKTSFCHSKKKQKLWELPWTCPSAKLAKFLLTTKSLEKLRSPTPSTSF